MKIYPVILMNEQGMFQVINKSQKVKIIKSEFQKPNVRSKIAFKSKMQDVKGKKLKDQKP